MRSIEDIAAFIADQPGMMRLLAAVSSLGLPDAWIGAGFVRDAVWDALTMTRAPPRQGDVDVVYFDPRNVDAEADVVAERILARADPGIHWSVKNQARMHRRNRDQPYRDTPDALSRWPETATAIAARLVDGRVEIVAPFGVDDLVGLVVRPTPAFVAKIDLYRRRVRDKNWIARWPSLTVLGMEETETSLHAGVARER